MDISNDVTATLRAQDHGHPPVICIQGAGATSQSSQGSGISEGGVAYTVNTVDIHAVCYDARGNGEGGVAPTITGDHQNRVTDYTAITVIDHSRRHSYQPLDTVPTLEAAMGTGGGNVPMVLMTVESTNSNARIDDGEIAPTVIARSGTGGATRQLSCWAVDSHPEDSRFKIVGGAAPTLTVKIAKGSADGPLILIEGNL